MALFRHLAISNSADARERMRSIFGSRRTAAGVQVTPTTAMQNPAVYACVRVLSEDVAKLPLILYRRLKAGGKERATDHRLYRLMGRRPNPWQTSFEFREMLQGHMELRGQAFAYKNVVGGRLLELIPLHPDRVTVQQESDYSLTYRVSGIKDPLRADQVLHLRGLASDGVTAYSPIALHRESIGLSMAAEQHGARLFGNSARPGGILEHPTEISEEAADRLKKEVEKATSGENQHRLLLLESGVKWVQVGLTNKDAQFLETRQYQRAEIASIFRVPPHKIGDLTRSTNNNIEHQALEYVQDTLMSRLSRWEQRLNVDLLTPAEQEEYFFEFLTDALLRGDVKSRNEAYASAISSGWMNRNEVRIRENMNPVPGLDEFLRPLNMDAAGAARE